MAAGFMYSEADAEGAGRSSDQGLAMYVQPRRGVLKDSVRRAHVVEHRRRQRGNEAARKQRDNLEDDMTRAEISRATELARTCMTSDYQDCEP